MQFKISAAAFLAFAASAMAQNPNFDPVTKPTPNEPINAGTSYTIEWTAPDAFKDVTVSISLIGGATQNTQVPLLDIASGISNSAGKYTWSVPGTLGKDAFYGLVIKSEVNPSDFQYSNPFKIIAGQAGSGTTTVVTSSGTATVTLTSTPIGSVTKAASPSASASASASELVISNSSSIVLTTAVPTTTALPISAPTITSVTRPATNGTATRIASSTSAIATVTGSALGSQATAGVFAVIGGLAIAALF